MKLTYREKVTENTGAQKATRRVSERQMVIFVVKG